MQETPQKNRTIMSVIAIVIGLLMAYLIPFLAQTSLERVLLNLTAHIEAGNPAFTSGLKLFDFFYPVWRALIFVAGTALIIISGEIRKGTEWTYPLAIALFAIPSIGGMFMFLPYVSWVAGFPLPLTISAIGLIGYFSFILLRKAELAVKWTRFGTLTFLGMLSTHAFTIGIGAQRTMWTRPGYPFYPDFTWWLFNWVGGSQLGCGLIAVRCDPLIGSRQAQGLVVSHYWFNRYPDDQHTHPVHPHQNPGLPLWRTPGCRCVDFHHGSIFQKTLASRRECR